MSKYFSTNKRGELQELKLDLQSTDFNKKKEAIKKVIAQMTVGKDVSSLFQNVIRCLEYPQADIKKLVKKPEDAIMVIQPLRKDVAQGTPLIKALALRTMGCLRVEALNEYLLGPVKEGIDDRDAYVRKTAALCVPKMYELNPKLIEDAGLIVKMQKMLKRESNPVVISNVMIALYEISQMSEQSVLNIEPIVLSRLLNCINECIEWGQVFILDCLANYIPKDVEETEKIIERIYPRLQHINCSVVFSAVKVLVRYMDYVTNVELIRTVSKKIAQPLISLINYEFPEIQYVILRNIHYLIQKRATIFENMIKVFFCKFNEPYYIKNEKIEILVKLCNIKNCELVLTELKECTRDVDVDFAVKSINAVGIISLNFEKFVDKSIEILMDLVKDSAQPPPLDTTQEVLISMMNIYRKYPTKIYTENSLKTLVKHFTLAQDANAKAAAVWMLGEYAEKIEKSVEIMQEFIENFLDEERKVQLSILTATVKIFLKYPIAAETIISNLLKTATELVQTPDVRDRAFIYWRMLSSDPEKTKQVVLSDKPVIVMEIPSFDTQFLDTMISNLAMVSSVAQKTPESIFKKKIKQMVRVEESAEEGEIVPIENIQEANIVPEGNLKQEINQDAVNIQQPIAAVSQVQAQQQQEINFMDMDLLELEESKPQQNLQQKSSAPQDSFNLFDLDLGSAPKQEQAPSNPKAQFIDEDEDLFSHQPTQLQVKQFPFETSVDFSMVGKQGINNLKIECRFNRITGKEFPSLEMKFNNKTSQKLESFVVQLKKNYFNLALEKNSSAEWLGVKSNQEGMAEANGIRALQLSGDEEIKLMETQQILKFQVAFKSNFELYFFEVPCSLLHLFKQTQTITTERFNEEWNVISPANMQQLEILELYEANYTQVNTMKKLLEQFNIYFISEIQNAQNQAKVKFYGMLESDAIYFEVKVPLQNGKGCLIQAKCRKIALLNFFFQGMQFLLAK